MKLSDGKEDTFGQSRDVLNLWVVKRVHNARVLRFTLILTRSPAQKSACKDLSRNGQSPAITPEAAYTPLLPALVHAQEVW